MVSGELKEVKEDRLLSGNLGPIASAAGSVSSFREDDRDGEPSTEDLPPMWLRDYKSGMEYEVYSLALHVPEDSCFWGLTFRRWAFDDSFRFIASLRFSLVGAVRLFFSRFDLGRHRHLFRVSGASRKTTRGVQ